VYNKIKPYLNRLNFYLGINPKIEYNNNRRKFIPSPYQSVLLLSADFELAWASRYTKSSQNPLQRSLQNAHQERKNFPELVALCEQYDIPVTWATVGHLFLESCDRENGRLAHEELPRLPHFENYFWRYASKDWFEHDPCTNIHKDPEWYSPDLIRLILDSPVKHEIGCHTFSHIDCRDDVCPPELMRAELQACKQLADEWHIELKSFVHPGYTIGNLDTLAGEGFTNYRTNYRNVLGYPKKHNNGLWEFEQTAEFVYRETWSIKYHIYRYKEIINRAIKSNTVCVLWFHPSFDPVVVDEILPSVFTFIKRNRDQVLVTTHRKYIDWLNKKHDFK